MIFNLVALSRAAENPVVTCETVRFIGAPRRLSVC